MYNFQKWLDRWVREHQGVGVSASGDGADDNRADRDGDDEGGEGESVGAARFPDDPSFPGGILPGSGNVRDIAPEMVEARSSMQLRSGAADSLKETETAGSFSRFWERYRSESELSGLSFANVYALLGGLEKNCGGVLKIRDDLPPDHYLALPFIRRCWRLLWILDEQEQGDAAHQVVVAPDRYSGGGSVSFSWSVAHDLEMPPESARLHLRLILGFLVQAGMVVLSPERLLSDRARELVSAGSPGAFYKALLFRTFNRCSWDQEDGLPPLVSIQLNGLYLLYVLHAGQTGAVEEGRSTVTGVLDEFPRSGERTQSRFEGRAVQERPPAERAESGDGARCDGALRSSELSLPDEADGGRERSSSGELLGCAEDAKHGKFSCPDEYGRSGKPPRPRKTDGTSALELAGRLAALNTALGVPADPSVWLRDEHVMARVIRERFLERVGGILGLIEIVPGLRQRSEVSVDRKYRPTDFARRVMLWNP